MWLCVFSGRNGHFVGIKFFISILHVDRDYSYTIFCLLHFCELTNQPIYVGRVSKNKVPKFLQWRPCVDRAWRPVRGDMERWRVEGNQRRSFLVKQHTLFVPKYSTEDGRLL